MAALRGSGLTEIFDCYACMQIKEACWCKNGGWRILTADMLRFKDLSAWLMNYFVLKFTASVPVCYDMNRIGVVDYKQIWLSKLQSNL